jgi:hypothetical protein
MKITHLVGTLVSLSPFRATGTAPSPVMVSNLHIADEIALASTLDIVRWPR